MKYAVNAHLITLTAVLAESMNLAKAQGLDLQVFGQVLDTSPMASVYSKIKVVKMLAEDWAPQAAIKDCFNSAQLIHAAAEEVGIQSPLRRVCGELYGEAIERGLGGRI